MKPYELMSESELQEVVAEYTLRQYPDVMFHSDFGSGVKLTPAQAKRQKRQNGYRRGWPDMFIAEPRHYFYTTAVNMGAVEAEGWHYGLFLELKKEGTRLVKSTTKHHSDGIGDCTIANWATEHIAEQAKVLQQLRERGYCAEFAVGFDEAKKIIDEYLGGKNG